MIYMNLGPTPRWQLFARTFPGDWEGLLINLWPDLEVDHERIKNKPTAADPLGAKGRVEVQYSSHNHTVRIAVDGDQRMPWLDPVSAETFMLVEWPHLFRRRTR